MQHYDFQNNIGFMVNRTAKTIVKAMDTELRKKVGITFGQWKVIVMLSNQNGLTQKEIADRLDLEGPTLIPIIDKMEKEGFVIRKVDPADRRNNRIYLTEKSSALWTKMVECALKIRQVSIREISEEDVVFMISILEKIRNNIKLEFDIDCSVNNTTTDSKTNTILVNTAASASIIDNTRVVAAPVGINEKQPIIQRKISENGTNTSQE